jgi:hypothetical protein
LGIENNFKMKKACIKFNIFHQKLNVLPSNIYVINFGVLKKSKNNNKEFGIKR